MVAAVEGHMPQAWNAVGVAALRDCTRRTAVAMGSHVHCTAAANTRARVGRIAGVGVALSACDVGVLALL